MSEMNEFLFPPNESPPAREEIPTLLQKLESLCVRLDRHLDPGSPEEKSPPGLPAEAENLQRIRDEIQTALHLLGNVHLLAAVAQMLDQFIVSFGEKSTTRQRVQSILEHYVTVLKRCGIELSGGHTLVGQLFNPRLHRIVATAPVSKKRPHGTIVEAPIFGVRLGEETLSYPQVLVADESHSPLKEADHANHCA